VLEGLTRPLPALSFEFQCAYLEVATRCVSRLAELAHYRFAVTVGGANELLGSWRNGPMLVDDLREFARTDAGNYGDVYAVLKAPNSVSPER
jgi:hypothetical protein